MGDEVRALKYLEDGATKFSKDTTIMKALGFIYYQTNDLDRAKKIFE